MGEDFSKIEDFSEPITAFKGAKGGVFWDVEDYPFPIGSTPDSIYAKIESVIRGREFSGEMAIWAYVDEKGPWSEFLRKNTWKSRIYFLPGGGGKRTRRNRMFHDILFWAMDSPVDHPHAACLIVVSKEVKDDKVFFHKLGVFEIWHYSVFIAEPTDDIPLPEAPEWLAMLLDQAFSFASEEASRKKA